MGLVGLASVKELKEKSEDLYELSAIKELIRKACFRGGLGLNGPDKPFRGIIQPGMTVLIKPNLVMHRSGAPQNDDCLITHPKFILAVLLEVIEQKPDRIVLGDAPIQGCVWERLFNSSVWEEIRNIGEAHGVQIIDFRRTSMAGDHFKDGVKTGLRPEDRYILFDLGPDSLLEPISSPPGRFRVTMYDPRDLNFRHHPGRHQYLICREALESQVIINLPKLKTHRKAGITGALKNLVGLNGDKNYLPHHRIGGMSWGGDCYPGVAPLKRVTEHFIDLANQHIGKPPYDLWLGLAAKVLDFHAFLFKEKEIEGSWPGNDTLWRMVLDLNRILLYGQVDGAMSSTRQRAIWTLTDAIVCGEGDGPLRASPKNRGLVTFSNSLPSADFVHAALFHFDPFKIPLLRESQNSFKWPLTDRDEKIIIGVQHGEISLEDAGRFLGMETAPPHGWEVLCQ